MTAESQRWKRTFLLVLPFPFLSSLFPVIRFPDAVPGREAMLAPKIVVRRGDGGGLKTKKAG